MSSPAKLDPRAPTISEQIAAVQEQIQIDEDSFRVGGARSRGLVEFPNRQMARAHECLKAAVKTLRKVRDEQRRARK
jgi:hypothetical protein